MVSWLLVILNHGTNFERFLCTVIRTKFLSMLQLLGASAHNAAYNYMLM